MTMASEKHRLIEDIKRTWSIDSLEKAYPTNIVLADGSESSSEQWIGLLHELAGYAPKLSDAQDYMIQGVSIAGVTTPGAVMIMEMENLEFAVQQARTARADRRHDPSYSSHKPSKSSKKEQSSTTAISSRSSSRLENRKTLASASMKEQNRSKSHDQAEVDIIKEFSAIEVPSEYGPESKNEDTADDSAPTMQKKLTLHYSSGAPSRSGLRQKVRRSKEQQVVSKSFVKTGPQPRPTSDSKSGEMMRNVSASDVPLSLYKVGICSKPRYLGEPVTVDTITNKNQLEGLETKMRGDDRLSAEVKGCRHVFRLLDTPTELRDWFEDERGPPKRNITGQITEDDLEELGKQVSNLLSARNFIESGDLDSISEMSDAEAVMISEIVEAKIRYASKLRALGLLPNRFTRYIH